MKKLRRVDRFLNFIADLREYLPPQTVMEIDRTISNPLWQWEFDLGCHDPIKYSAKIRAITLELFKKYALDGFSISVTKTGIYTARKEVYLNIRVSRIIMRGLWRSVPAGTVIQALGQPLFLTVYKTIRTNLKDLE